MFFFSEFFFFNLYDNHNKVPLFNNDVNPCDFDPRKRRPRKWLNFLSPTESYAVACAAWIWGL